MPGFRTSNASQYEKEFVAAPQSGNAIDVTIGLRQAHALEYIAYHMGQIDQKFDRLIEAAERAAGNYPKGR